MMMIICFIFFYFFMDDVSNDAVGNILVKAVIILHGQENVGLIFARKSRHL